MIKRDYEKEADWERQKYKRYQYRCPKQTAVELDKELKKDNLSFADLARQIIAEYLKKSLL